MNIVSILIVCAIICFALQFILVGSAANNRRQLFNHDLGWDFPTPFAIFLIVVPGSFIIFSTVKFVKFAINFTPNMLQKRKSKKERIFKEIEYKYDKIVKEAQNV